MARCVVGPTATQMLGSVCGLALDELVAGLVPAADLGDHVVEDEVAPVGLHGEDGVAVALEVADDGHEQGLAREAEVDEQLALPQRVDFAVALAVRRVVPNGRAWCPNGPCC